MRRAVGVCLCTVLGFLQLGVACAISGVVAHLDGLFKVTGFDVLTTCALSMGGHGVCTYSYISTAVGIILSVLLVGLVCATLDNSRSVGFCGPIISFVGFVYFLAYAGIVTASAAKADGLSREGHALRVATYALGWSEAGLFALTFFLSAATAKSTLRGDGRRTLSRALSRAKYYQPAHSPASSPKKALIPMEQGSPKKWSQPHNPRTKFAVTSDGVRTLLVVAGTPMTLSRTSTLAPGSGPSSVAGSLPASPMKQPGLGAAGGGGIGGGGSMPHAFPHSFSMPGLPRSVSGVSAVSGGTPGARATVGVGAQPFGSAVPLPHALTLNAHPAALARGVSLPAAAAAQQQQLARNSSSALHQALLQRVVSSGGGQHRLAQRSGGSSAPNSAGGSSGSSPRDPVNRV